jgi:hypothetical protein
VRGVRAKGHHQRSIDGIPFSKIQLAIRERVVMFECREVRSVVRLAHDLLDSSSADYPSLVQRPWRNSLAATVIRVTSGAQIPTFRDGHHRVQASRVSHSSSIRRMERVSRPLQLIGCGTTSWKGVTGGLVVGSIIGILLGLLLPAANSYADAQAP